MTSENRKGRGMDGSQAATVRTNIYDRTGRFCFFDVETVDVVSEVLLTKDTKEPVVLLASADARIYCRLASDVTPLGPVARALLETR